MAKKTADKSSISDVVARVQAALAKLEALVSSGQATTTILLLVQSLETLLALFGAGTPPVPVQGIGPTKCGPDGCQCCSECLDCSIACTVHALAMQIQAKSCDDCSPKT